MNDGEKPSLIGDVLFNGRKPGGIRGRREERSEAIGGEKRRKKRSHWGRREERSEAIGGELGE